MITGFLPISTAWVYDEITVRFFLSGSLNGISFVFSTVLRMYSGVVPQQPPIIVAPAETISRIISENSSAPISKTVFPFSVLGRPALGLTIIGTLAFFAISGTIPSICFGPSEQLMPIASAPRPSSIATIAAGFAPVISFLLSS